MYGLVGAEGSNCRDRLGMVEDWLDVKRGPREMWVGSCELLSSSFSASSMSSASL